MNSSENISHPAQREETTEYDPKVEKSLLRKLDFCLMPFISIMYLFNSLDRSNIGNAKLGSFEKDLHLQGNDFYNALMIFYLGYILLQIPSNLALKLTKPSLWIGTTTIIWGISSTSIAATVNVRGLIAARFFLGCAEAGLGPCVPLLLSFWYQRHELASRFSIFMSAATLAGAFAGALAYLIMDNLEDAHGLASWRWMFIIEGAPTIALGILCLLFLPNYPETASKYWLTKEEKAVAIQRAIKDGKSKQDDTMDKSQIMVALLDYKTWFVALINSAGLLSQASFTVFLPTIVRGMGFEALQSQLLTIPPYIAGCIFLLFVSKISDRICQRGLPIMVCAMINVIGYIFLIIGNNIPLQYTGVVLIALGIFPIITLGYTWLANNQLGHTKRGVSISVANMVSQAFALLGTQIYRDTDAPNYRIGHSVCLGFALLTLILAYILRTILARKNKQLTSLYGPPKITTLDDDPSEIDPINFRFIL